jgi:hypothetical protein
MKISVFIFLSFVSIASNLFGADSKDPLLDAELNLVLLRIQFREEHPRIFEAKAIVSGLAKTSTISAADHIAAIQERLVEAEIENTAAAQKYRDEHPARVPPAAKLAFLKEALRKAQEAK